MMASVGNGYAAFVIDGAELYVGGIYNGPAGVMNPSHRAALVNYQGVKVSGQLLYGGLNMEQATYTRVYQINPQCTVTQTFYAHRTNRHLLVQSITVDNTAGTTNCLVTLSNLDQKPITEDFTLLKSTVHPTQMYTVREFQILTSEAPNGVKPRVGVATSDFGVQSTSKNGATWNVGSNGLRQDAANAHSTSSDPQLVSKREVTVAPGAVTEIPWITAIWTDLETQTPFQAAESEYLAAVQGYGSLFGSHTQSWESLWSSRIEVGGNLALAQIINSSIYYTLSSIRADWPWSLSPGGLASNGYNGHVFWDAETWMYPPLLTFWPDIARDGVLRYRSNHLQGAQSKAKSYPGMNWKGAMFPWESAFSGIEVCPTWAPTGLLEQHITGDIAFASRQYYYATGDNKWLSEFWPVIQETGNFWVSRVTPGNSAPPHYNINDVIPPDEYAVGVNNSVYTNYVASVNCDWVAYAGYLLGVPSSQIWGVISSGLKLPFSPSLGVHLEYDGYNGQKIKQADVVLLGYPLEMQMSRQIRQNDLKYYESRTDPEGPAMTWAMHAIGWLELGKQDKADPNFQRAYANSHLPFGVWTETPTGGTVNFLTGAGGFLQSVINGYGGMRVREGKLDFRPFLPPSTTSLALKGVALYGSTFDVSWNTTTVLVTASSTTTQGNTLTLIIDNVAKRPLVPFQTIALNFGAYFSVSAK
jgi:trehalose/maltose hydrolase-like predicted phosphorylase